nr:hypothetical protein YSBCXYJI_YSBCXYJI_CDS_0072 [Caudoviricetes sp.]
MKIKDEEREIIFKFKNAEEHEHFVQVLKQTRDSTCRAEAFCFVMFVP